MNLSLKYKLVLGSKSPRRHELLKSSGFYFTIRTQDGDESFPNEMPKKEVAKYLAVKKADVLMETLSEEELLITADSVVIINNQILNKPENFEQAKAMLSLLSNEWHEVATGVCLTTKKMQKSFTTFTQVKFDILSDAEMNYYINNYRPFDKAGSYGIQDWIGLCKVSEIVGSYSNVMGLPMRELYNALLKME